MERPFRLAWTERILSYLYTIWTDEHCTLTITSSLYSIYLHRSISQSMRCARGQHLTCIEKREEYTYLHLAKPLALHILDDPTLNPFTVDIYTAIHVFPGHLDLQPYACIQKRRLQGRRDAEQEASPFLLVCVLPVPLEKNASVVSIRPRFLRALRAAG